MPWVHTQAARGDIILVGDLMKSLTVLRLAPDTCRLIECASRSAVYPGTSFAGEPTYPPTRSPPKQEARNVGWRVTSARLG